jgi:hypothetical protein
MRLNATADAPVGLSSRATSAADRSGDGRQRPDEPTRAEIRDESKQRHDGRRGSDHRERDGPLAAFHVRDVERENRPAGLRVLHEDHVLPASARATATERTTT